MPTEYTLNDLAKLAHVTPRTIRYYIVQGLLPSPSQAGTAARYSEAHLDRLRLIKKLQSAHLPLAEIRARLRGLGDEDIATMAETVAPNSVADSAVDYVRRLLGEPSLEDQRVVARRFAPSQMPAPAALTEPGAPTAPPAVQSPASAAIQNPALEPDRSQWERISLDPDVEIHVRRPLGRLKNRRVDRLIAIARQLLEED